MVKVTKSVAEQEHKIPIDGIITKYRIVPEIAAKLRAELYFWENLPIDPISGRILIYMIHLIGYRSNITVIFSDKTNSNNKLSTNV